MTGTLDVLLWLTLAAGVALPHAVIKHRGVAVAMSLLAVAALAAAIAGPAVDRAGRRALAGRVRARAESLHHGLRPLDGQHVAPSRDDDGAVAPATRSAKVCA